MVSDKSGAIHNALAQATYSTKEPFYEMDAEEAIERRIKSIMDHR